MSAPLDALPEPPDRRLALRLRPAALRQLRKGHPWVYAESIESAKPDAAPTGALGVVFDDRRDFAGIGLWDPDSPIRLRVVHRGSPIPISSGFWREKLGAALELRAAIDPMSTTGYRLINGENDGFGGLIIDRFADVLVVKIYTPAWFPHLREVVSAAGELIEASAIVARLSRRVAALSEDDRFGLVDGQIIAGDTSTRVVEFLENGLRFHADVLAGPKTGHFLDQRENRARVRSEVGRLAEADSGNVAVLDVFACSGGFSVNAAVGGAQHVHSVDLSPHAIDAARAHMDLNVGAAIDHRTTVGDAFVVLDELGAQGVEYDMVIVDPPAFATRQRDRDAAMRAYRKLAELAVPLVRPGGRLVQASCSTRVSADDLASTVEAAVRNHARAAFDVEIAGHAVDHPVTFAEGQYLDAWFGSLR